MDMDLLYIISKYNWAVKVDLYLSPVVVFAAPGAVVEVDGGSIFSKVQNSRPRLVILTRVKVLEVPGVTLRHPCKRCIKIYPFAIPQSRKVYTLGSGRCRFPHKTWSCRCPSARERWGWTWAGCCTDRRRSTATRPVTSSVLERLVTSTYLNYTKIYAFQTILASKSTFINKVICNNYQNVCLHTLWD